jgi:hypothetical protein
MQQQAVNDAGQRRERSTALEVCQSTGSGAGAWIHLQSHSLLCSRETKGHSGGILMRRIPALCVMKGTFFRVGSPGRKQTGVETMLLLSDAATDPMCQKCADRTPPRAL